MVKKKGEGQFKGLIRGFGFTLNKPKREPRSQPGAKANKYTCQLALSPADSCTFALTHTQRNTKCTASRLTPHASLFTRRHSNRAGNDYKPHKHECIFYLLQCIDFCI